METRAHYWNLSTYISHIERTNNHHEDLRQSPHSRPRIRVGRGKGMFSWIVLLTCNAAYSFRAPKYQVLLSIAVPTTPVPICQTESHVMNIYTVGFIIFMKNTMLKRRLFHSLTLPCFRITMTAIAVALNHWVMNRASLMYLAACTKMMMWPHLPRASAPN